MFKNYFILNRLAIELNQNLESFSIMRAFSFEKDKLVLVVKKNDTELSLELSVNPQLPYIILKNKVSVPKRNLIDFFSTIFPVKLEKVEISNSDRIIKFSCDRASIYFTIRGKNTNVFLISLDNETESFKKSSEKFKEDFTKEILESDFITDFRNIDIKDSFIDSTVLRKEYPFIGKEIINEVKLRGKEISDKISVRILIEVIENIKRDRPTVFIDEDSSEINLGIESLKNYPFTKKEIFPDILTALEYFLIKKFSIEGIEGKRKIIEKYLDRELQKTSNKLNDINSRIQRGSKEEEYSQLANTLLLNIDKIHKGFDKIELSNLYSNNENVIIKLEPKLSPKQNIEKYFEKAKNERQSLLKATHLAEETKKKLGSLKIDTG